jgi:hypothetical protein
MRERRVGRMKGGMRGGRGRNEGGLKEVKGRRGRRT